MESISRLIRTVVARDGARGKPTGTTRHCQLEGCRGTRVGVKWPDGKTTWPCTRGMEYSPKATIARIP